jgi:2-polyprenyl-6-methoxyphenol hydroxylase-like FAD-dependent oxidoreductase
MYDVIVVGARVAGSSTAMLLARGGCKVLVVDRASFPSDTLSSPPGAPAGGGEAAALGLLDRVVASGAPPTRAVRFDTGEVVLDGRFPAFQGVDAMYSPRRTVLDRLLVEAAGEAGAEVREGFTVEEVLLDGGRVTGIRGRARGGAAVTETARLVVGADGRRSLVARTAGAAAYHQKAPLTMAFYTYWEGVPVAAGGEIYARPRRAVGAWPTNDGLVMTYIAWPVAEFPAFRADVEGNFLATLDLAGDLGERVRAGRRAERFRGSPDLPGWFRTPYGPGWALVGDAGLALDPITGQGISDAFRDAELLAGAVDAGLGGRQGLQEALAGYQRQRDQAALAMYEFTAQLAAMRPPRWRTGCCSPRCGAGRPRSTASSGCWPAARRSRATWHPATWCGSSACAAWPASCSAGSAPAVSGRRDRRGPGRRPPEGAARRAAGPGWRAGGPASRATAPAARRRSGWRTRPGCRAGRRRPRGGRRRPWAAPPAPAAPG